MTCPQVWEISMKANSVCVRDTDGDGDCHRCQKHGCPLQVFRPCMVDRMTMSQSEVAKFKTNAERFEYREPWLGVVRGYRSKEGMVLIEQLEPSSE